MKFTKGQPVYNTDRKECAVFDHSDGYMAWVMQTNGITTRAEKDLRALHSTPGFYVPEVGDMIQENCEWLRVSGQWDKTDCSGTPFLKHDRPMRFPLPPDALES